MGNVASVSDMGDPTRHGPHLGEVWEWIRTDSLLALAPLNSESNLIHFPGGALAKSKIFSYALTRV